MVHSQNWLSDLEIFATLVAAVVHDYEHTGTTNNFHVMSGSETALLYNDRAVLENHHISAAFRSVYIQIIELERNNVAVGHDIRLNVLHFRVSRGIYFFSL